MAEIATNFPPRTYSSSFFLNSLVDEDKTVVGNSKDHTSGRQAPLLDCFISTMLVLPLVLAVLFISSVQVGDAVECVVPNESPVRFFNTISEYQSNRIPFRPGKVDWQGSSVAIRFPIQILQKNAFVSYDSESLIVLNLSRNYIKQMDDGAFISLFCLSDLLLDHNNITKLSKSTFQGLHNLRKLDLSHNMVEVLPNRTFQHCPKLQNLNLAWNRIRELQSLSFSNMTALKFLNLESNRIETITAYLFASLVNLETLIFDRNRIVEIEPEKWAGLTRLRMLDLAENGLKDFDPMYNFSFFNLENLNLSSNRLERLDVLNIVQHLPNLKVIDLDNNQLLCGDLEQVMVRFNHSNVRVITRNVSSVSIHGVRCSDSSAFSTTTTTSLTVDFVDKKFEQTIREVKSELSSLRTLIIAVGVSLGVGFIALQFLLNTRWGRNAVTRIRRGNRLYLDDNNVENFGLLNR